MNAYEDYPELYQFFGGWFHQDWRDDVVEGGDWPDAVDDFIATSSPETVAATVQEMARLLATDADDEELDRILDDLGSNYLPDGGCYREWLTGVRDRLTASK